jgi:hypothetical protein
MACEVGSGSRPTEPADLNSHLSKKAATVFASVTALSCRCEFWVIAKC